VQEVAIQKENLRRSWYCQKSNQSSFLCWQSWDTPELAELVQDLFLRFSYF